jgi:hypothetical protein
MRRQTDPVTARFSLLIVLLLIIWSRCRSLTGHRPQGLLGVATLGRQLRGHQAMRASSMGATSHVATLGRGVGGRGASQLGLQQWVGMPLPHGQAWPWSKLELARSIARKGRRRKARDKHRRLTGGGGVSGCLIDVVRVRGGSTKEREYRSK